MNNVNKWWQSLIVCFGICFSLLLFSKPVSAHESLPPGMIIGDDSGIYATQEGDYYIDLPSVKPGEVYKKEITIRSMDLKKPFELGLLVEKMEAKGEIDFNKHVSVTLTMDEKELYSGPLLGDGSFDWKVTPVTIGEFSYGTDKVLHVKISVDKSLDISKEHSSLLYKWTFIGTKKEDKPIISSSERETTVSKPKGRGELPWTGEEIRGALYKILAGILVVLIVLLLWKKKKDSEKKESDEGN